MNVIWISVEFRMTSVLRSFLKQLNRKEYAIVMSTRQTTISPEHAHSVRAMAWKQGNKLKVSFYSEHLRKPKPPGTYWWTPYVLSRQWRPLCFISRSCSSKITTAFAHVMCHGAISDKLFAELYCRLSACLDPKHGHSTHEGFFNIRQ